MHIHDTNLGWLGAENAESREERFELSIDVAEKRALSVPLHRSDVDCRVASATCELR